MHIHLDLVGGISGDMFVGAMLDCFPELATRLAEQVSRAGFGDLVTLNHVAHTDGVLTGTRFQVTPAVEAHAHGHRHYSEIREILEHSSLEPSTKHVAQAIFRLLAEAEASIHGKRIEDVAFHEMGAWDSIADIISAATIIAQSGQTTWSMSSLPLGRGRVKTAHGILPIPAPATALLLKGFDCFDDGIEGERITPTGAAILCYLSPAQGAAGDRGKLAASGYGFGTKEFPGMSNVLRVLVFEPGAKTGWLEDQVLELAFEIDDQTAEDLATGLETIRAIPGVIDVLQYPAYGKKGRQFAAIRILGAIDRESEILTACFEQTTTLGIRKQWVDRSILARDQVTVSENRTAYRVKVARRPSRTTAKAEMADLAGSDTTQASRSTMRARIESSAIHESDKNSTDE